MHLSQALVDFRNNIRLVPPAIVAGAAFGLFASGYWLIDILPASSRLLIVLSCLLMLLGMVACFLLLRWAQHSFPALSRRGRIAIVVLSLFVGAAFLLGGTSQWTSARRYVPFLLPSHRLQISIEPGQAAAGQEVRILWFSTSLGDISYDTIQLKGWKRVGDELVLVNPAANSLEWSGKTGAAAEIVFRDLPADSKLSVKWDSGQETIVPIMARYAYQGNLDIPWYASRALVLALGELIFALLAFALMLVLWERRAALRSIADRVPNAAGSRLDKMDAVLIVAIMVLALLLRLPNLGRLFPAVDEYYHLIAARQIAEGAALGSVYPRGLWIVTVPMSLAMRTFGYELWAARLVGVLFNVLAIVPLFLLTSKMNRGIALLSAALFATSPWIVTFARIAREYAFYPFYFYWVLLGMVCLIRWIPEGSVVPRDWKAILTPRLLLTAAALTLPPLFALYGDRLSTFRTILLAYPIFGLFVLARFDLKDRSNWPFLALLAGGLLIASFAWYERQKAKILPFPRYNSVPVEYFLPNPQQQWYFGRLVLLIVVGLLAAAACSYLIRRRNFLPLFVFTLFAGYLAFFALFSMTFFHTRHLSTTELWYVILVAVGLYLVWKIVAVLLPWKSRLATAILAAAIGISVINTPQLVLPTISTNPDDRISEDYLHDMTLVQAFMLEHVEQGDVLISTVYGLYASWREEPRFAAQYRINTQTPLDEISTMIAESPSGWIVIDRIRLDMSTPGAREFAGIADVQYVGLFGDESVWHWQHLTAGQGNSIVAGKAQ